MGELNTPLLGRWLLDGEVHFAVEGYGYWSVCPSGWQLAQAKVPVLDAFASLNAIRPRLKSGSLGSLSPMVAETLGFAGPERSTRETLLASAFSTQARNGAPASVLSSATPRGTQSVSTRPSTSPVSASTVNSRWDAAAVTTSVESSLLTAIPNGVASARSLPGLPGGNGSTDEWGFLAEPPAVDLLETLPSRYIDRALAGCLRHVIHLVSPPEPVIAACRLSSHPELHAADIAYIHILQGRFDEAESVFAGLPGTVGDTKPARTGLASTRAAVAMLRGDNVAARDQIEAAIAEEKAGTRKRNVFPEHATFALALIALVRVDTPESHALLDQLLRTAERRYPDAR